jgi:predicted transcriptional regulator
MSKKALTVRLDIDLQKGLATLSKIMRRPTNKLVIEAVRAYLDQHGRKAEHELEASLADLRAYRKRDPDFEQAIKAFAKAEVSTEDPIEGQPVKGASPLRTEIRKLLNA